MTYVTCVRIRSHRAGLWSSPGMRNPTKIIASVAATALLASAGWIGSAATAGESATGAFLPCPDACIGSGSLSGGIIRDLDINGYRINATMRMVNTYRSAGGVYYAVASVPVTISIPDVPGWATTTWLRDATVSWNGLTYAATAAVTRSNHVVVHSRSTTRGSQGSFHAELAIVGGTAVTGAGEGAYYGPGDPQPTTTTTSPTTTTTCGHC